MPRGISLIITRKRFVPLSIFIISFIIISLPVYLIFSGSDMILEEWSIISILIVSTAILAFIINFQRQTPGSKEIALIIVLGTMTAILRIPFTILPNIQPCTFLIICTGITFGPSIGFLVGVLTPLISNLFLGHGPWTPLQMYAWGVVGAISGLLNFNPKINRWKLGAIGVLSGYLYGFIMNIWFWYSFLYPLTIYTFILAEIQGIYFDTLHAIGNFIFLTILGNKLLRVFNIFKEKFGYINA